MYFQTKFKLSSFEDNLLISQIVTCLHIILIQNSTILFYLFLKKIISNEMISIPSDNVVFLLFAEKRTAMITSKFIQY